MLDVGALSGRPRRRQIDLVEHGDRLSRSEQRALRCQRARGVEHDEDEVGASGDLAGAIDADALHLVGGLAQACGIVEHDGHAVEIDAVFEHVARRPRPRRDDRTLGAEQGVEQARFTDVGLADDGDAQSVAQQTPACRCGSAATAAQRPRCLRAQANVIDRDVAVAKSMLASSRPLMRISCLRSAARWDERPPNS